MADANSYDGRRSDDGLESGSASGGTEHSFGTDKRGYVLDKFNSTHAAHAAIWQVRAVCKECKTGHCLDTGTCFMVGDLNEIPGKEDFYYFVTAAHVIFCRADGQYRDVQIVQCWEPGEPLPGAAFPPVHTDEYIEENNTWGWLKVSEGFQADVRSGRHPDKFSEYNQTEQDGLNSQLSYPYDYGVIAARKKPEQHRKSRLLEPMLSQAGLILSDLNKIKTNRRWCFDVPGQRDDFAPKAFLCGYPGEVLNGEDVRGHMYWVPTSATHDGQPPDVEKEKSQMTPPSRRKIRDAQLQTSALYPLPQRHFSAHDGDDVIDDFITDSLYRHYIDSSGGQSGAPVYTLVPKQDGTEFIASGIHVGMWRFVKSNQENTAHNVAVRLSECVDTMKTWVRDNHNRAPNQPLKHWQTSTYTMRASRPLLFRRRLKIAAAGQPQPNQEEEWKTRELRDVNDLEGLAEDIEKHLACGNKGKFTKELVRLIQPENAHRYDCIVPKHIKVNNGYIGGDADVKNVYGALHWAHDQHEVPKVGDAFEALCVADTANEKIYEGILKKAGLKKR